MSIANQLWGSSSPFDRPTRQQLERTGLTLARVTNVTDEQKLNRVKCLAIGGKEGEETDWCYVMTPMGGKSCGQFFFPNVDDLVLLAYVEGDPHRPVVLGGFWNDQVPPPYTIEEGKVQNYSIKTPTGTEQLFYDEPGKQKVTITLPSGTVLSIDDEAKTVDLKDKGGENALSMDLNGGNLTLKAKTKLTLDVGGNTITIDSSGNVEIKGSNKVSLEAANLEMKASASAKMEGQSTEIKASMLKMEGSGTAALKGGMVQIN